MMISLQTCTAPKVITPEINRKSYQELRETQPDCTAQIAALQAAKEMPDPKTGCSAVTSELILDALYCYRSVWKHWESEYRVLDSMLEAARGGGK